LETLNITTNNIYAVGDIHGYFASIISTVKRYEITDSCIIVCGDCGLGFSKWDATKTQLSRLNELCKKHNITIVMFRGNHDDPSFFTRGKITSNIIPVPDYTVINDSILCVGGATSIDRQYRMQLKNKVFCEYLKYHPLCGIEEAKKNTPDFYWENELPVYDEAKLNEIKEAGINITTVCTHTCPTFCDPISKDDINEWIKADPDLNDCIDAERGVMDRVYDKLIADGHPVKDWIYGHYHRRSMQFINDIKFIMLDAVKYEGGNVDWIEIRI
jgi:DNA repair exonuclease SbcCD nuclease subunit